MSSDIQCGICRRNLLTGEQSSTYRDPRSEAAVPVCTLCLERAERNGWLVEDEPVTVAAVPEDANRTVRILTAQINTLQHQLEHTKDQLDDTRDHTADRETELESLGSRLADAETEGAALRAAVAELERRLEQARHELEESQAAQGTLLRARRREADPTYLAGIAAEIFNRSPQAATIGLLVGLHGTPSVRIDVVGFALPRAVRLTFAWPSGGREYRVDIDLVARTFDLVDLVPGGDGRLVELSGPVAGNADWIDGRVVTAPAEPTML